MTKYELVGKIMSLGAKNKGELPSSKMAAKDEAVKLLDEYLALNIPLVMPSRLTAEQGHKALLIGEFYEDVEVKDGVMIKIPISWDKIKDIYKTIVSFHSA